MKTRRELVWEANRIRQALCEQKPQLAAKLLPIRFEVTARMTRSAGMAYPMRALIKLSLAFFESEENFEKEFRKTVIHEIAHILVPPKRLPGRYKAQMHGFEWQMMDRSLGGDGSRCHTLELAAGYTARRNIRVEMPCFKCGLPVVLKQRQAQVYRAGIEAGSLGPGTGHGFGHIRCP